LYPRKLTEKEKELLFMILPENKSGYAFYRNKINDYMVTGEGRFGEGNYFLGEAGSFPDLSLPSAPVFALGTIYLKNPWEIDIIIHEEDDNQIEVEFGEDININQILQTISDNLPSGIILKVKTYSEWIPGNKSPFDGSDVRLVGIKPAEFILVISSGEKKIWLHQINSGVNHLVPVSNYYNSLMLFRNERNAEKVLNPNLFFNNLGMFNDNELASAFILYNQYMRRRLL
jgi:hypothetical protein